MPRGGSSRRRGPFRTRYSRVLSPLMTEQTEQALVAYAEKQTRALEAIKVAVWVLASFAIAAAVLYLVSYLR